MTRGGPRPGAGRPPGTRKPTARRSQVNVRLSDAELAEAERVGDGNASEGVRRLIGKSLAGRALIVERVEGRAWGVIQTDVAVESVMPRA